MNNEKWREFLLVTGAALLLVTGLLLTSDRLTHDHPLFGNPWDHHKYIRMASGNPFDFHIAPFGWRIGVPLVAKALPFDLQRNFLIVAFTSIWATGVTIYYIARRLRFQKSHALAGMLMFFSLGWATKVTLIDFWLPDALSFLILSLSIYSIFAKKDLWFAALLVFGVAVKEVVIFVVPLYYTLNARRPLDLTLARRAVLLGLPAVLILIAIRLAIPKLNDDLMYLITLPENVRQVQLRSSSYDYLRLISEIGLPRVRELSLDWLSRYTVGTFGVVVTLLPFFSARANSALFVRFIPFLAPVYAQLLFAVDVERLIVAGFPALVILALHGVRAITEGLSVSPVYFIALPLLSLAVIMSNPTRFTVPFVAESIMLIFFLALVLQVSRMSKHA